MAKTDFSWVNAVDLSTIVAGSESSTLLAANLASPKTARLWRANTNSTYFTSTFLTAQSVAILALATGRDSYDSALQSWVAQLAAADTVRHRLYDAATGTGTLLYDSGVISCGVLQGYGLHVHTPASIVASVKSWRCDIVATSRASYGFFDITRAWAGTKWRPAVGIDHGWSEAWADGAQVSRGVFSGGVFPGDGPRFRVLDCSLGFMGDTDKLQAKDLTRLVGLRKQVLLVPDQDGDVYREAILGRLASIGRATEARMTAPPVYQQPFSIIQDL